MATALGSAPRSLLYVPANRPDMLDRAVDRGADALILDLEDAVPLAEKREARNHVAAFLTAHRARADLPQLWVRINPGEEMAADIEASVWPAVTGLCVAKADLDGLEWLAPRLERLERARHVPAPLALAPLLETAAAVVDVMAIARSPRVLRLQVGEADLAAELGVSPSEDERELLWVRSQVVLASAAAGIEPPVGPVSTNFRDLAALRSSTEALARLGYRGRCCIHPAQVGVVNEVFTPTREEVDLATRLLAGFEAAGSGVFTAEDGTMVDQAVIRSARRMLATHRANE